MSKEAIVQTVAFAELVVQYTAGSLRKWQVVQQCQEGLFDGHPWPSLAHGTTATSSLQT